MKKIFLLEFFRLFPILLMTGLSLLTSCHRSSPFAGHLGLSCRTQYLTPLYLASEQVDTPDPLRRCFYGQQIIIKWNLPLKCMIGEPPILHLNVRYGTRERAEFAFPIRERMGYWVYQLVNEEYWCKEGIISYQATLSKEGMLLDSWTHHLWSEIIEIGTGQDF